MEQIIYSKFSNERSKILAIRTDILQDETGSRSVRKSPVYPEGAKHVLSSLEWEQKLTEKYAGTRIHLNHGVQDGNSVRFEYLEGKTLENILDELYAEGKYDQLIELFRNYIDIIRSANGEKKFKATKEFENVFGAFHVNRELAAADFNNLDMVVSNIIVSDDTWNVIDYEWTFDFPIPVNFIIFRIIHYYVYETAKREALQKVGFYHIFGITEREQKVYRELEVNFQKFVIRGMTPISNLYHCISKGAVKLDEMLEFRKRLEEETRVKVYFDYGNGFSEQDTQWFYPGNERGKEGRIIVGVKPGIKGLRIDPAEDACLVQVNKMVGKADYTYELEFTTNARQIGKSLYLFTEEDPWFCISNLREGTIQISLDFIKEPLNIDFAEGLKLDADKGSMELERHRLKIEELIKAADEHKKYVDSAQQRITIAEQNAAMESQRANGQEQRAVELEKVIADLNHRLYLAESSFHEIQGSFCWKITKPVRLIGMGIRGFFRRHYFVKGFLRNIKRFFVMGPKGMKQFNAQERIAKRSFHVYDEISVTCDMAELEEQRNTTFSSPKKFSIVVPLYNTPELYLRKMIESVLYQTYDNLELCMADGSDKEHKYVKDICKEYRYYDKRIHYKKLKKNLGIADNTNACLEMTTGDYIVLFDHDDFLHPSALFENMKAIEEKGADFLYSDENTFHVTINDAFNPHYKPDYAPDTLRSNNYICHLSVFSRELYKKVGGFRRNFDGSQDYDIILRLTEQAKCIVHIPKVLYFWRAHPASVAMNIHAKDYCITSAKKALLEHFDRVGLKGTVEDSMVISTYRIKYELDDKPLVSILIPNCEHKEDLQKCLDSIYEKSAYPNFEVVIVENNSKDKEIFDYYEELQKKHDNLRVVEWKGKFNYAAINNYGAQYAEGEYLLLLNNDVEIITEEWIEEMLMFAQREDVGAVGVKLFYPDDTLQHAGVYLGVGGVAGHCMKGISKGDPGYFGRASIAQNVSCVTAACMMIPAKVFREIDGFDEKYEVAFNDVDLCMRIRKAGYLIVFTPYAELYHYESKSRGTDEEPEKRARFVSEVKRFQTQWKEELLAGDPYYNPNLTLVRYDYSPKSADEPSLWII